MGHKWALDVFNYGLANWGFTTGTFASPAYNPRLASRILAGPWANWILLGPRHSGTAPAAFYVGGSQLWVIGGLPSASTPDPHFPYGLTVEADAPT